MCATRSRRVEKGGRGARPRRLTGSTELATLAGVAEARRPTRRGSRRARVHPRVADERMPMIRGFFYRSWRVIGLLSSVNMLSGYTESVEFVEFVVRLFGIFG